MSEKQTKLRGRVAAILNAHELVINLGQRDGVVANMKFAVLAASPVQVLDPETKEVLDTIDREKTRVMVSEIRDRVAICRTFRVKVIPGGIMSVEGPSNLFRPKQEIRETLAVALDSVPPPLSEEESFVKVGDRVLQVLSET